MVYHWELLSKNFSVRTSLSHFALTVGWQILKLHLKASNFEKFKEDFEGFSKNFATQEFPLNFKLRNSKFEALKNWKLEILSPQNYFSGFHCSSMHPGGNFLGPTLFRRTSQTDNGVKCLARLVPIDWNQLRSHFSTRLNEMDFWHETLTTEVWVDYNRTFSPSFGVQWSHSIRSPCITSLFADQIADQKSACKQKG